MLCCKATVNTVCLEWLNCIVISIQEIIEDLGVLVAIFLQNIAEMCVYIYISYKH